MEKDDLGAVGETKPWYASKTILGAILMAATIVLGFFGVTIDETTKAVILSQTEALIGAATALIATILIIYGRVKATKAIGKAVK